MVAISSKGVIIYMLKENATGVSITPTDASKGAPSVITTAATSTAADGNLAVIPAGGTGLESLDGSTFIIDSLIADTSFNLLGSNTSTDTGTFATTADITVYGVADMVRLCLNAFTVNPGSPSTVSTATFCDPTASIPSSVVEAGTVDIGGYVDITDADYQELLAWDAAGGARNFVIVLPQNGYIVFEGSLGAFSWDIPLDGAIGWTGSITLAGKPRHLF